MQDEQFSKNHDLRHLRTNGRMEQYTNRRANGVVRAPNSSPPENGVKTLK